MAFSLSITDFVNTFSQMVATRGTQEEVTSDNGRIFVGSDKELIELTQSINQEKIVDNSVNKGIKWNWNPPEGS